MGFAEDYNTVAERIIEFRSKHPEGSLQPYDPAHPYRLETLDGKQCVVVVAAAYRTPDDTRPGIGMAYEPIPGPTQFTRGSELQNAETAAWGRAIVAALAADTKKGIATYEEVAPKRQPPRPTPWDMAQAEKAIKFAKGNVDTLRAAYMEAQASGAAPDVLEHIHKAAAPAPAAQPLEGELVE